MIRNIVFLKNNILVALVTKWLFEAAPLIAQCITITIAHIHTHIHLHPRYHPQIGLKTIAETEVEVSKLQQQILAFRPQLEKQQESNDEMLKVISLRTHEA